MKVLVIEGDLFVSAVYQSELRQVNIEVEVAADGKEGLEKAKAAPPDLIITELILLKINGFELIKELKADPKLTKVPVVVASALNQQPDVDEALAAGAAKFLPKDIYSPQQIIMEVTNLLSSIL